MMLPLVPFMAGYARYHRDSRNKCLHLVGVPTIVLSIVVPLRWVPVQLGPCPDLAAALLAALALLYCALDLAIGAATSSWLVGLWVLAGQLAPTPARGPALAALALFVVGWIIQLTGHWFEGRKPALVDNLLQVFVAPFFVTAEVAFLLGLRRTLRRDVDEAASQG